MHGGIWCKKKLTKWQLDNFPLISLLYIDEHLHEGVGSKNYSFCKNDMYENFFISFDSLVWYFLYILFYQITDCQLKDQVHTLYWYLVFKAKVVWFEP